MLTTGTYAPANELIANSRQHCRRGKCPHVQGRPHRVFVRRHGGDATVAGLRRLRHHDRASRSNSQARESNQDTRRHAVQERASAAAVCRARDCLVLCLVKMNRILELDHANLTILVEPVSQRSRCSMRPRQRLFYPPDPGSMKISTIGGNVAENSGGLRGLKCRHHAQLRHGPRSRPARWRNPGPATSASGMSRVIRCAICSSARKARSASSQSVAATDPQTRREENDGGDIRADGCRGAVRLGHHRGANYPCTLEFLDRTTIRCVWKILPRSGCRWIARRCC